jgi:hypothetical protein
MRRIGLNLDEGKEENRPRADFRFSEAGGGFPFPLTLRGVPATAADCQNIPSQIHAANLVGALRRVQ